MFTVAGVSAEIAFGAPRGGGWDPTSSAQRAPQVKSYAPPLTVVLTAGAAPHLDVTAQAAGTTGAIIVTFGGAAAHSVPAGSLCAAPTWCNVDDYQANPFPQGAYHWLLTTWSSGTTLTWQK